VQSACSAQLLIERMHSHLSFGSQSIWSLPPVRLKNGCASATHAITRRKSTVTSPRLPLYAYDSAGT
jgi:hypothetical protein